MPNLNYSQLMGIKKAATAAKAANIIDIGGLVASTITETIFSISNAREKQAIATNLAELKETELQELEGLLKRQANSTERLRVLLDYISRIKGMQEGARIKKTIGDVAGKKSADEKRLMKIIFGGALALILIGLIIKKIRK
jgi:hypothetical protein